MQVFLKTITIKTDEWLNFNGVTLLNVSNLCRGFCIKVNKISNSVLVGAYQSIIYNSFRSKIDAYPIIIKVAFRRPM